MKYIIRFSFLLIIFLSFKTANTQNRKETITFTTKDNVVVTADIYLTEKKDAPFILLFHQAMFSRGEYIEIAPKLNDLGFNCIAIDQRSGLKVNGIKNQTHKDAIKKDKKTKYKNAYPDLEATLNYVKQTYSPKKIIIWGSSYSSSLVFILAAKHKEISALLSFSPGEYFTFENKKIADWAKEVECPVFVTSSKKEADECSLIFKNTQNKMSIQFVPDISGFHGSKALWENKKGHEKYWFAVKLFLNNFKTENE